MAHLLASFPSHFTKILAGSAATACEFLYCLTKNPTAQLHHRNYTVMPVIFQMFYAKGFGYRNKSVGISRHSSGSSSQWRKCVVMILSHSLGFPSVEGVSCVLSSPA